MSRKEWLKAISFIIIFLMMLLTTTYIVRTNGAIKDRFTGFYAEEENTIDVMMFGGSTIGTSFSPGYLWGKYGITSYALSSNTQRPKAISYLWEEALRYQKPQLLVVELRMFTYEDEELKKDEAHTREVTDNLRYSFQRLKTVHALTDGVSSFEEKLSYYFDIIKYHSNWGMFFEKDEWTRGDYKKKDLHKGYEAKEDISYQNKETDQYVSTEERIAIPKEQEIVLRNLIGLFKQNNQKVVFTVTPCVYGKEYYAKMNYMKDIIEEEGFYYLNIQDYIYYDCETDYYDGGHSNVLGAKKCTDVLGKYIQDVIKLPQKQKNDNDKTWNESYEAFLDSYNKLEEYKFSIENKR